MRFDEDPDVRSWQADPGKAPGYGKGKLALVVGAGVLVLTGYLLMPLDLLSSLIGPATPVIPQTPVAGSSVDLRDINSLANRHVPKRPVLPTTTTIAEATPVVPAEPDPSLYADLKARYDALNDRLNGLLGQQQTPQPTKTTTPAVKTVDQEAKRRAEDAKRRRQEMLQSPTGFLTRPTEEKIGQLHALKSPFSLAPSEEIPIETTMTISSDTLGAFVAVVSQDVPDTATRTKNVIPKGSKFVLKPRRGLVFGDSRIDIEARTLTFPSGPWLKLPASTATDAYGTAGFTGDINRHYIRNYGAILLTSVLRGGSTILAGGYGGSASDRVTGVVAQDTANQASQDARQFIRTDPTIVIANHYQGRLLLEEELVLTRAYPWTPQ